MTKLFVDAGDARSMTSQRQTCGVFDTAADCPSSYVRWLDERWQARVSQGCSPSLWNLRLWDWFVGSVARAITHRDREGKYINELPGEHTLWIKEQYRNVALLQQPVYGHEEFTGSDGQPTQNYFGMFPIFSKNSDSILCLAIDDYRLDTAAAAKFDVSRVDGLARLKTTAYLRTTSPEFLLYCRDDTIGFFAYWDSKRGDRIAPSRADIDPLEMKPWLPGVMLVDVNREPFELTYRLVGTRCVDARGFDPTGRSVQDGFFGPNLDEVMEGYRLTFEEGKIVYRWNIGPAADGTQKVAEMLMLPLSTDGAIIDKMVVYYASAVHT